jgi:hypothetical protein
MMEAIMRLQRMDRQTRQHVETAMQEINAILEKHQCMLVAETRIVGNQIRQAVQVMPKPLKVETPPCEDPTRIV